MPRTPRMVYVPLDVEFFDNAKVLEAGEKPGWLYLNMLARAKRIEVDGVLTTQQVERLQVSGWKARMTRLIEVGLVARIDDGRYVITGFLQRNPSADELAEYRRKDAQRKRPDSKRNDAGIPRGMPTESGAEGKRSEDKRSEGRSDVDRTTHQALRAAR